MIDYILTIRFVNSPSQSKIILIKKNGYLSRILADDDFFISALAGIPSDQGEQRYYRQRNMYICSSGVTCKVCCFMQILAAGLQRLVIMDDILEEDMLLLWIAD
jgi:hypothetical protein